ncbi:MAG: alpha-amylase [Solobacterium sp.]|nr:alpha-amylase [Solobacterium sp.]
MAIRTDLSLRSQVIYQIFTRNYKDGTFRAVEADLDRIRTLGADWIYLLPIQPSGEVNRKGSMGSPYAIKDYRAIDPVQGTMEEFISLCKTAHQKGLKVMLDVVYNHTSPDSVLSREHPEWFYHKPDGSFGNRVGEWWDVIDLDYSDHGLWEYQIDTLKMWAEYVDGFRCDVAPMIPLEFWLEAREAVEAVRPGCVWLAEAVEPEFIRINRMSGLKTASDGELYQAFDICYDYDVYFRMQSVMAGTSRLEDYLERVNLQEMIFPENYIKLRCLENHDRMRAADLILDERALRNWTAWNYFQKGTVMLYAGQEYEAVHHPTLFDHDPVNFETGKDLTELLVTLKMIKQNPVFRDGFFEAKAIGQGVIYAELRNPAGKRAVGIFAVNGFRSPIRTDLPYGYYENAVDGSVIEVFDQVLRFDGEPVILLDVETKE